MLVLHFSYYTSMTFRMILSVIFLYMLMILLSTLNVIRHLICGNSLNWLLNLNLTYETLDLARKWPIGFNAEKTQLALFDQTNKTGPIDVKMDGSVLEERSSFKILGLTFLLNWIGVLTLFLLLKLPPRKLELWFVLWSFFLLILLWISINLSHGHVWNTAALSGLVLLIPTWNFWISYKNGYAGHLLPLLNSWFIVEYNQDKMLLMNQGSL